MYTFHTHTHLSNIGLVHLTPRTLGFVAETDRRCDTPWNDLSKAGTFLVATGVWKRRVSRGGKQDEPQLPPETQCLLNYFKGSISVQSSSPKNLSHREICGKIRCKGSISGN